MRKKLFKIPLYLIALAFITEIVLRLIIPPVDYLIPVRMKSSNLLVAIPPNVGGHDDWGFRNRKIPDKVDIVTIGDNITYGVTVPRYSNWPSQLSEITGQTVYNLSMGGWAAPQYLCVLEKYALNLKPKAVVFSIYLANDIFEAYRNRGISCDVNTIDNGALKDQPLYPSSSLKEKFIRFLKENCLLFSFGLTQALKSKGLIVKSNSKENSNPLFSKNTLKWVSVSTPEVKEGLDITLDFLKKAGVICQREKILCMAALVPSKESVYHGELTDLPEIMEKENYLRKSLINGGKETSVFVLDLLSAFQQGLNKQVLYNVDQVRPNKAGMQIIAKKISEVLE